MSSFLAILWKDLVTEWRGRDRIAAMLLFSLLVVVIFHFSLPGGATRATQATAPGLLWIAYVFAALLHGQSSRLAQRPALTGFSSV